MFLEYVDKAAHDAPLLFLGEVSPSDAATLRTAFRRLASGAAEHVMLHELGGYRSRGDARDIVFVAHATAWDGGCRLLPGALPHIQCALRPSTWDQVVDLLEPFAVLSSSHAHQYLSEQGEIIWVVSTDSSW